MALSTGRVYCRLRRSHHLATVEHADEILVIEGGRLVERGRHAELLAHAGTYRRLHDTALKGLPGEQGRTAALIAGQA